MPDVAVPDSLEAAVADTDLVLTLEHYMAEWGQLLAGVMQRESEKQPQARVMMMVCESALTRD
jgi:hypothetical protein